MLSQKVDVPRRGMKLKDGGGIDRIVFLETDENRPLRFQFADAAIAKRVRDDIIPETAAAVVAATPRQKELCVDPQLGSFFVTVIAGTNLMPMDPSGKSDPYVRASLVYKAPGKVKQVLLLCCVSMFYHFLFF